PTSQIRKIMEHIEWSDFQKIDIRVGTIIDVEDFPEARRPAYKLKVDLGSELGIKKSSAQITALYSKEDLLGKQVLAVVNFAPKQIGPIMSECLVTGLHRPDGSVVLSTVDMKLPNGAKLA
ncbi:tRNA-binding protein, partial [Vibrio parahaemolyticus]